MEYLEIVRRLRENESIKWNDVSLPQILMLVHDQFIKQIVINESTYRIFLIDIDWNEYDIPDNEAGIVHSFTEEYDSPPDCTIKDFFNNILFESEEGIHSYLDLIGEPFEIILDLVETE